MDGQVLKVKSAYILDHLLHKTSICLVTQSYVDVTIICRRREVMRAHKIVLAAASSFLKQMFEEHGDKDTTVIFPDIKGEDMRALLSVLYTGSITATAFQVNNLLGLAKMLSIDLNLPGSSSFMSQVSGASNSDSDHSTSEILSQDISHYLSQNFGEEQMEYQTECLPPLEVNIKEGFRTSVHTQAALPERCLSTFPALLPKPRPDVPAAAVHPSNMSVSDMQSQTKQQMKSPSYTCEECGKGFKHEGFYKRHVQLHDLKANKPVKCDLCDKEFTSKNDLRVHKAFHKTSLKLEPDTHSEDKLYPCDQCNQKFTRLPHLQRHKELHSETRKYCCDICGRQFTRSDHVNRHVLNVHKGEKPFACEKCGKRFSRKDKLAQHKRDHEKEELLGWADLRNTAGYSKEVEPGEFIGWINPGHQNNGQGAEEPEPAVVISKAEDSTKLPVVGSRMREEEQVGSASKGCNGTNELDESGLGEEMEHCDEDVYLNNERSDETKKIDGNESGGNSEQIDEAANEKLEKLERNTVSDENSGDVELADKGEKKRLEVGDLNF